MGRGQRPSSKGWADGGPLALLVTYEEATQPLTVDATDLVEQIHVRACDAFGIGSDRYILRLFREDGRAVDPGHVASWAGFTDGTHLYLRSGRHLEQLGFGKWGWFNRVFGGPGGRRE